MNNNLTIKLSKTATANNCAYDIFLDTFILIGKMSFTKKTDTYEVAVEIDDAYRNKGFGTVAVKLVTEEFADSHDGKVIAYIDLANIISQKIFLKSSYHKIEELEIRSKRYVKFQYNK